MAHRTRSGFCSLGLFLLVLAALASPLRASQQSGVLDVGGHPRDPFASNVKVRVLLFLRTDCPLTNRYAPELQRLALEFPHDVDFWLIYPDTSEPPETIEHHVADYHLPGTPLRDLNKTLVKRAHATVAPEAAVFDSSGKLIYHGRIDDRYIDFGKARPRAQTHDLENAIAAVLDGKPVVQAETRAVGCSLRDVE